VSILEDVEKLCFSSLKRRYPDEKDQGLEYRFWNIVAGPRHFEATNTKRVPRTCRQVWNSAVSQEMGMSLPDASNDYRLYFSFVFRRMHQRCIFHTSTDHVGLGPPDMREGDLVCVVYGCRMCVVLRSEGDFFRIIGMAVVDGAMGGEYVRAYESGKPGCSEQVRLSIV
jgi:hypothetical protein